MPLGSRWPLLILRSHGQRHPHNVRGPKSNCGRGPQVDSDSGQTAGLWKMLSAQYFLTLHWKNPKLGTVDAPIKYMTPCSGHMVDIFASQVSDSLALIYEMRASESDTWLAKMHGRRLRPNMVLIVSAVSSISYDPFFYRVLILRKSFYESRANYQMQTIELNVSSLILQSNQADKNLSSV